MQSAKALKALAGACGIPSTGCKAVVIERIHQFHQLVRSVDRVVSIDLGTRNLALAEVTQDLRVHRLQLHDLDLPERFNPRLFAGRIRAFAAAEVPGATPVLVERQRCRTMGSRAIPEAILRVNFVEAMLHCFLLGRATSVLPDRVASTFGLPKGREKKKASTDTVQRLIAEHQVAMPGPLHDYYMAARKKDDLSDSLLQAIAFFRWRENCLAYMEAAGTAAAAGTGTQAVY